MKIELPGIADELFLRGDVPMTKQEIRLFAVTKARIGPGDTVIDIGAGTGSFSVEAALSAPRGRVFAIEKEADGVALIKANAAKFGAVNIEVRHGAAPQALDGLPAADVIFVGGSGGQLDEILSSADNLLNPGGRLIITAVTLQTLHDALTLMQQRSDYGVEATGIQITRMRQAGSKNMFQALNPIYIIACTKGGSYDR
jgi:precorrin-6Y C5,15-methyltransferase (decarboxylating) CbiT subunit